MLPGVGVFGTGLTARVIVPLLKAEGFAVKALWGRTPEEAEELAKEMSVPFYTSRIDEVLLHQDVDLVCVNLPPPLTRQVAVKTLGEWGWPGGGILGGGRGRRPRSGLGLDAAKPRLGAEFSLCFASPIFPVRAERGWPEPPVPGAPRCRRPEGRRGVALPQPGVTVPRRFPARAGSPWRYRHPPPPHPPASFGMLGDRA